MDDVIEECDSTPAIHFIKKVEDAGTTISLMDALSGKYLEVDSLSGKLYLRPSSNNLNQKFVLIGREDGVFSLRNKAGNIKRNKEGTFYTTKGKMALSLNSPEKFIFEEEARNEESLVLSGYSPSYRSEILKETSPYYKSGGSFPFYDNISRWHGEDSNVPLLSRTAYVSHLPATSYY